jgi:hypothetical protein
MPTVKCCFPHPLKPLACQSKIIAIVFRVRALGNKLRYLLLVQLLLLELLSGLLLQSDKQRRLLLRAESPLLRNLCDLCL